MNLWVPWNARNFLTSWGTVSSSRSTLLHRVSYLFWSQMFPQQVQMVNAYKITCQTASRIWNIRRCGMWCHVQYSLEKWQPLWTSHLWSTCSWFRNFMIPHFNIQEKFKYITIKYNILVLTFKRERNQWQILIQRSGLAEGMWHRTVPLDLASGSGFVTEWNRIQCCSSPCLSSVMGMPRSFICMLLALTSSPVCMASPPGGGPGSSGAKIQEFSAPYWS